MNDEIPFWMPFDGTDIPRKAKIFGSYRGQNFYIGRAEHQGSLTPGIVLENDKICIIPWGTISNQKRSFEILVGGSEENWVCAENGQVPLNAFHAGHSEQGETLFIGRFKHNSELIVGKIQPSHSVCYISYENNELNNRKYEVFVV